MEGSRARGLLKSLSIKQGRKYDSPESAKEIPSFIQFHRLKVDEILDPIPSFSKSAPFFVVCSAVTDKDMQKRLMNSFTGPFYCSFRRVIVS